jgi:uncharacterized protein
MKIVISGASGFIGKNLINHLNSLGHHILILSRIELNQGKNVISEKLNGVDAVINLSGATISKRWSRKYKREIYCSRVQTTRKIIEAIGGCEIRPKMLINASAIGIYDTLHENDEHSEYLAYDYLGKVVRDWEYAAFQALEFGVSVSVLRFGLVLGKNGGIIKKLLPVYKMGVGGLIGNGKQAFCYIHIADVVNIIAKIIDQSLPHGTYNVVSPVKYQYKDFNKELAKILHVPSVIKVPFWLLKIRYGEGAKVLTEGQISRPTNLLEKGYEFKFSELSAALMDILKK